MNRPSRFYLLAVIFLLGLSATGAEPIRQFAITEHGAVADGQTLNTDAIQNTITAAASAGGGTVVIPKGVFLSGAIFLKPGVNLHLDESAVLKASTNMVNFPERRIRIEGHFEEHFNPALVNADGCAGLRIDGGGTLDGSGRTIWDHFWKLRRAAKDQKNFRNLSVPRAQLCIINNSKNVVVDGVTFKDSQYWNLHLYNCRNVLVQNARFQVPDDYKQAPSTDGIDVDSCQDVEIKGCYFSVTDDCIAMKGTSGPFALQDKESLPVERVHISGCMFRRGHAAVTCGSEATIVRKLVVENCRVTGAMSLLTFKLRPDTSQCYEDIQYRNITLDNERGAIFAVDPWTQYSDLKGQAPPKSVVRNVTVSDIRGSFGSFGDIIGTPEASISNITLENIDVQLKGEDLNTTKVANLKMKNVSVNGKPFALKPASQR